MKRKLITPFIILLVLIPFALFAQPMAERQYAALSGEVISLDEAEHRYAELATAVAKERTQALNALEDAQKIGDRIAYAEARKSLDRLATYRMSRAQSDALLEEILLLEEPERSSKARWLAKESPYYAPQLILDFSSETAGYRYSYHQVIQKDIGKPVTLPQAQAVRFNTQHLGLLAGWQSEDGSIRYEAGETIEMPALNLTLIPLYEEGIRFSDWRSGFDELVTSKTAIAPTPVYESDKDYFLGWLDRSTNLAAQAGESISLEGKGAYFEGVWKALEIEGIALVSRMRKGSEIALGFSYYNSGDVALKSLTASLSSESEYVRILSDSRVLGSLNPGYRATNNSRMASRMRQRISGLSNTLRFVIDPAVPSGTKIILQLTIVDDGGADWKKDLVLTIQ